MKDFFLIFTSRINIISKSITTMHAIRIASFIFVIGCFLTGSYYIFFRLFNYLITIEIIGTALMDRVIEMGFFVFFIMLLFSNIITSFSTFYNDKELQFLFALPVRPTSIYLSKLFENCVYASWATMAIAVPLVVAYGVTTEAGFLFYPLSIMSLFIYLIIPAALASVLIFVILRLLPQLKTRDVILLAFGLIIGLTFLYIKINNPAILKVFETENERELLRFAAELTTVGGGYVPSTWLSNILKGLSVNSSQGIFYFLLLFFVSVSTAIIAFFMAKGLYAQSWLLIGEHSSTFNKRKSLLTSFRSGSARTLFFKDILLFVREPTQWVQLSIFVILLVVYIFSLRRTPIYFTFPLWRTIVSFANFAYICFVLATLGVRFIFPTISLERSGIWIIGSSPLSFKKTVMIKYFFYLLTAVIIIEGLLIFSNIFIKTDHRIYMLMPIIALFIAASLVSINLGFGGLFPQFDVDNPSQIAAGTGGIITALASIAYVGISILILSTPAYHYLATTYLNRPSNYSLIYISFIVFFAFNIFTIVMPLRTGIKALEKRDF
jgi:ABC-2 type transport system permease protein